LSGRNSKREADSGATDPQRLVGERGGVKKTEKDLKTKRDLFSPRPKEMGARGKKTEKKRGHSTFSHSETKNQEIALWENPGKPSWPGGGGRQKKSRPKTSGLRAHKKEARKSPNHVHKQTWGEDLQKQDVESEWQK